MSSSPSSFLLGGGEHNQNSLRLQGNGSTQQNDERVGIKQRLQILGPTIGQGLYLGASRLPRC